MKYLIVFVFFLAVYTQASGQHYLFYLHGKIVEDQGADAIETVNGYGKYEYNKIVETFRSNNFNVISEVRPKNTDPKEYSLKVVKQIDSLIKKGVKPGSITVVGASKGSIIAMLVSSTLKNKQVNFVFMAACNENTFKQIPEIQFYGNILSIYEKSDVIGKTCSDFRDKSKSSIGRYDEIELNTSLRHGFIFKPIPEWIEPAMKWAKKS